MICMSVVIAPRREMDGYTFPSSCAFFKLATSEADRCWCSEGLGLGQERIGNDTSVHEHPSPDRDQRRRHPIWAVSAKGASPGSHSRRTTASSVAGSVATRQKGVGASSSRTLSQRRTATERLRRRRPCSPVAIFLAFRSGRLIVEVQQGRPRRPTLARDREQRMRRRLRTWQRRSASASSAPIRRGAGR